MTVKVAEHGPSKVPAVTLGFWIAKILATTLGETAGDTVSMSWLGETTAQAGQNGINGYLVGTGLFGLALALLVALQVRARTYRPALYWATIIASTTAGTTLADFADRSLGIGYAGGSLVLLVLVLGSLALWKLVEGRVSSTHVVSGRTELFYWMTITFSQTLGTALGDWAADDGGLGYLGGAALFGGAIAVVATLYFSTRVNRTALFWAAFILTRPLGATVGDFLDKPFSKGGLDLSRPVASLCLAVVLVAVVAIGARRGAEDAEQAAA
ncbi:hypothetical protein LZ519_05740 [Sphingomonas sp. RG327]|uniref:Membrane-anchored protein n=1 Tax=Sphingomonas anseongensis TaxID=2908207 RepID=A0ABT0RF18_9SPHN|nr:hypothetical protein [Sphingomonas anseongensis]MCL6678819.1 hypothetical protein [Sphingomonas anseongensis]